LAKYLKIKEGLSHIYRTCKEEVSKRVKSNSRTPTSMSESHKKEKIKLKSHNGVYLTKKLFTWK